MELPQLTFTPKSIFVAPLNWGLGHATRSADIIMRLMHKYPDAVIRLGSDGVAATWLRQRFPGLELIELPGYGIRYSRHDNLMLAMVKSAPRILRGVILEHRELKRLIRIFAIDLVISDNRFGLWSRKCTSVFVTHQLHLLAPRRIDILLMRVVNILNRCFINRFDRCWVPDYAESPGLAGVLSHPAKSWITAEYIGPLSRFRWVENRGMIQKPADLLCIVSGPEPQRSIFLNLLLEQLRGMDIKTVIVAGIPGESIDAAGLPDHITLYPHLPDEELLALMKSCRLVVSRSGYSTIMDISIAGGKAAFIPTPGQSEQEYLAELYKQSGIAFSTSQERMNIAEMFQKAGEYKGF